MREERLKILSMLQEGKITPEEAERLLSALAESARAEGGDPRRRRRPHGPWDFNFDFDFGRYFDPHFKRYGPMFDDHFRAKFRDKMRDFRNCMQWGDEQSRREAREWMREAANAVKEAVEKTNLKETIEDISKSVLDAMEEVITRFRESRTQQPKPGGGDEKAEESDRPAEGEGQP